MPRFEVTCVWEIMGSFYVEADTLEDAISKVENEDGEYDQLPSNDEYVDGSFQVVLDCCRRLPDEEAPE